MLTHSYSLYLISCDTLIQRYVTTSIFFFRARTQEPVTRQRYKISCPSARFKVALSSLLCNKKLICLHSTSQGYIFVHRLARLFALTTVFLMPMSQKRSLNIPNSMKSSMNIKNLFMFCILLAHFFHTYNRMYCVLVWSDF